MSNYEATKYDFDGANLSGIEGIPTATIVPWSSASVPSGFLECDGTAVSRSTYADLFSIIGTTYGSGDGSTTFNVPDLQDNVAIGKSPGKALGTTGGSNTTPVTSGGNVATNTATNTNINVTGNVGGSTANASLSTPQLASHRHNYNPTLQTGPNPGGQTPMFPRITPSGSSSFSISNTGSGGGHSHNMSANFAGSGNASSTSNSTSNFSGNTANPSILQPYLTVIYIIKT
jgi:microcystin-dependent protein